MAQETIIERIMLMQRSRRKRPRAELGGTALCLTRRRRSNCDLKKSPLQETIAPKNQHLIHGEGGTNFFSKRCFQYFHCVRRAALSWAVARKEHHMPGSLIKLGPIALLRKP
jgi:hypothetical protein